MTVVPAAPIRLAHEPPFAVGACEVKPAILEVQGAAGRERLEPRIMQVFVALVRSQGKVVSRDDLIASCWDGRIVGDDAVNRCIARLRRLAGQFGGFTIETLPRIGYRLETGRLAKADQEAGRQVLLAVLPFDDLSEQGDLAFFSDGVSEEILHTVARRTGVRVIGRASSFCFRGAAKSARNVGAELSATHLLDGSVRRSGDRVRVSVELVECADQTTLWSDRFDYEMSDILALQDAVAEAVATALKLRFAVGTAAARIDPSAYDLYLQTRPAPDWGHVPPSRAIGMLERVVELAPDFAGAWGELAHNRAAVFRGITLDPTPIDVRRADVVIAAERALWLDPSVGSALIALAHLLPWSDHSGRSELFEKAGRRASATSEQRTELGWFQTSVGRNAEALETAIGAMELDPLDARVANLFGQMLCAVGRYEDCQRAYGDFRRRWPTLPVFISVPLILAATMDDWPRVRGLRVIAEAFPEPPPHLRDAQKCAVVLGDPTPSRIDRILSRLADQVRATDTPDLGTLVLAHQMGCADEVFAVIDAASFDQLRSGDGAPPAGALSAGVIFGHTNRRMIEDPRFPGLCAKLGLCEYWQATGQWPDCAEQVAYPFKAACESLVGQSQ